MNITSNIINPCMYKSKYEINVQIKSCITLWRWNEHHQRCCRKSEPFFHAGPPVWQTGQHVVVTKTRNGMVIQFTAILHFSLWPFLRCAECINVLPAVLNNTKAESQACHRTCTRSLQNATQSSDAGTRLMNEFRVVRLQRHCHVTVKYCAHYVSWKTIPKWSHVFMKQQT